MGKQHVTEEQITFALRQAESGTSVAEVIRKLEQLVADLSLDKKMLRDVLSQKLRGPQSSVFWCGKCGCATE